MLRLAHEEDWVVVEAMRLTDDAVVLLSDISSEADFDVIVSRAQQPQTRYVLIERLRAHVSHSWNEMKLRAGLAAARMIERRVASDAAYIANAVRSLISDLTSELLDAADLPEGAFSATLAQPILGHKQLTLIVANTRGNDGVIAILSDARSGVRLVAFTRLALNDASGTLEGVGVDVPVTIRIQSDSAGGIRGLLMDPVSFTSITFTATAVVRVAPWPTSSPQCTPTDLVGAYSGKLLGSSGILRVANFGAGLVRATYAGAGMTPLMFNEGVFDAAVGRLTLRSPPLVARFAYRNLDGVCALVGVVLFTSSGGVAVQFKKIGS
jgi:hypothetical protein